MRFIGYVPNTDLMDAGPDYGNMFITQDKLCDGTKWHKRDDPRRPRARPVLPDQPGAPHARRPNGAAPARRRSRR